MRQQGDVLLCQTSDGGEIEYIDGIVTMSPGLDTAAYLSLFGGNEEDSGGEDITFQWWGNFNEPQKENSYRSETQHILQSIPSTPNNLLRIENAAKRDLQWLLDESVASSVEAVARMPALNTLHLTITIEAVGELTSFEFVENWEASV